MNKIELWYISCETGCTCCSWQDFHQGFYKSEKEAKDIIEQYLQGIDNPLASQYEKHGRYNFYKCEAEILPDGRIIVDNRVYSSQDYTGHLDF